jgi:hypothetical protein
LPSRARLLSPPQRPMNLVPVVSIVSTCSLVWRGLNRASAGHSGLTHIVIFFFVVKFAAAGDRRYLWRGRRRAAFFFVVCNIR